MNKIVSSSIFVGIGLSLGIFGVLIALTLTATPSSESSVLSSTSIPSTNLPSTSLPPSSEPQFFDTLMLANGQPTSDLILFENLGYLGPIPASFSTFFEDTTVNRVAISKHGIMAQSTSNPQPKVIDGQTISPTYVSFHHFSLEGVLLWEFTLTPSDKYLLDFDAANRFTNAFQIPSIIAEEDGFVIPITIYNKLRSVVNNVLISTPLGGNLNLIGVSEADEVITLFLHINPLTHEITPLLQPFFIDPSLSLISVNRLDDYRYLVSYSADFSDTDIDEIFAIPLLETSVTGLVLTEITFDRVDPTLSSERLITGMFSLDQIVLLIEPIYNIDGTLSLDKDGQFSFTFIFFMSKDHFTPGTDIPLTQPALQFIGTPILTASHRAEIIDTAIEANEDDESNGAGVAFFILYDHTESKNILTQSSRHILYPGRSIDPSYYYFIYDEDNDFIYMIQLEETVFINDETGDMESISFSSVLYVFYQQGDRLVSSVVFQADYAIYTLIKIENQFFIIGFEFAAASFNFDNGDSGALFLILLDENFDQLDYLILSGDKDINVTIGYTETNPFEYIGTIVTINDQNQMHIHISTLSTTGSLFDFLVEDVEEYIITIQLSTSAS